MLTGILSIFLMVQAPVQGRPVSEARTAPVQPRTGDAAVLGAINAADASITEAAKLASTKAGGGDVRSLASTMVTDHRKSLTEGGRLAKALGITRALPTDTVLTHAHETAMHELNLLSGSAFDARFIQCIIAEHQTVIKLLEGSLGSTATRPEVRQFLAQQLPLLHSHLAAAEKWQAAHPSAPTRKP
ncbi:MAG: DUF4142 domain-containing protein [Gemmatimonadota bacterium]